jgi:hypothetical protein
MPSSQRLVGTYRAYDRVSDEEELDEDSVFAGYELDIPDARRIELSDGRVAFVFEGVVDGELEWECRLESRGPGSRRFIGAMRSPSQPDYPLDTILWVSPDGDEWLLLGSYVDPDDGERIEVALEFELDDKGDADDD